MTDPRQTLGQRGEALAAAHLHHAGWTIQARNWRHGAHGEIDIIAHDGSEVVFVEVRTRRGPLQAAIDAALESITETKRARLLALAQAYLDTHDLHQTPWRVDAVAVAIQGAQHHIEVIHNALAW